LDLPGEFTSRIVGAENQNRKMQLSIAKTRKCRGLMGFTLSELMVAMGIGSFVFISLYAGVTHSVAAVQRAKENLRATQIIMEKFEVIRLYNWSQINTPGFIPSQFTEYYRPAADSIDNKDVGVRYQGTLTLTNADVSPAYSNTMKKVVAEVSWATGSVTNTRTMETFVSEHGIQNYLY
jgi:type II secretory pathway pseudopilin PulG